MRREVQNTGPPSFTPYAILTRLGANVNLASGSPVQAGHCLNFFAGLRPGGARGEYFARVLTAVADTFGFKTTVPWAKLKKSDQKVLLYPGSFRRKKA